MVFGRIRRRRRQRAERAREREEKERRIDQEIEKTEDISKPIEDVKKTYEGVREIRAEEDPRTEERRQRYKSEAREAVTENYPGITEENRRALQERANAQINRMQQQQSRAIASRMGSRGVRGGAAEAPQQELNLRSQQLQTDFQGGLAEMDERERMQRMAAALAMRQGLEAGDILRDQGLFDLLTGMRDQNRERAYRRIFGSQYGRL